MYTLSIDDNFVDEKALATPASELLVLWWWPGRFGRHALVAHNHRFWKISFTTNLTKWFGKRIDFIATSKFVTCRSFVFKDLKQDLIEKDALQVKIFH